MHLTNDGTSIDKTGVTGMLCINTEEQPLLSLKQTGFVTHDNIELKENVETLCIEWNITGID